jgi:hypothetical protein
MLITGLVLVLAHDPSVAAFKRWRAGPIADSTGSAAQPSPRGRSHSGFLCS